MKKKKVARKSKAATPPPVVKKPEAVKPKKKKLKKTVPNFLAGKVRSLEEKVGHYRRALGKALYQKRMTEMALKESQKKALLAIATAATALSAAAQVLVEADESEAPAAPAELAKKEPAKTKKEEKPKAEEPKKEPGPPPEKSIMDKVRDACKEFAGINGREALREVLNKYTDKTVADIPADKLVEFLKDLGG